MSCSHPSQWEQSHITGSSPEFTSNRFLYHTLNPLSGIDVEFIELQSETFLYLSVHGQQIERPLVTLTIDDNREVFEGFCHVGGQRITVPEQIKNKMIESIFSHKKITIRVEGYYEELERPLFLSKHLQAILEKKGAPHDK